MKRLLAIISLLFIFNIGLQAHAQGELSTKELCGVAVRVANIAVARAELANDILNHPLATQSAKNKAKKEKEEARALHSAAGKVFRDNNCGKILDTSLPPFPSTIPSEF